MLVALDCEKKQTKSFLNTLYLLPVPNLALARTADNVWLVVDHGGRVEDDQGGHEVAVHPQTVALQ